MPTKTIVYLSGPMTGLPEHGFPAFDAAADQLRWLGYRVINPADFGVHPGFQWADYLARDLALIGASAVVCQIEGWESSKGAVLEADVARRLGKDVVPYKELVEIGWNARKAAMGWPPETHLWTKKTPA